MITLYGFPFETAMTFQRVRSLPLRFNMLHLEHKQISTLFKTFQFNHLGHIESHIGNITESVKLSIQRHFVSRHHEDSDSSSCLPSHILSLLSSSSRAHTMINLLGVVSNLVRQINSVFNHPWQWSTLHLTSTAHKHIHRHAWGLEVPTTVVVLSFTLQQTTTQTTPSTNHTFSAERCGGEDFSQSLCASPLMEAALSKDQPHYRSYSRSSFSTLHEPHLHE